MNPTRLAVVLALVVLAALAALPVLATSKESGSETNRKLSEIRRTQRSFAPRAGAVASTNRLRRTPRWTHN
jgi:hypothetical protein